MNPIKLAVKLCRDAEMQMKALTPEGKYMACCHMMEHFTQLGEEVEMKLHEDAGKEDE